MGNFRETNWFKFGELVDVPPETEPLDELPFEDRYLDDGTTTYTDSVLYGVHTGETTRIPAWLRDTQDPDPQFASTVIACDPSSAPTIQTLVRELEHRNRTLVAMCGTAVIATAIVLTAFLFGVV